MNDLAAGVRDRTDILCTALAQWADPGSRRDKAAARRARHNAIDAIDALLRDLYLLRGRIARQNHPPEDAARNRLA